jgi:hypothetical protein
MWGILVKRQGQVLFQLCLCGKYIKPSMLSCGCGALYGCDRV